MSSYYGCYNTRTFINIFQSVEGFANSYIVSPLNNDELEYSDLKLIYYLLYSRYGNSHIASSDENQFEYNLYSIIWQYAPDWKKQVSVQKRLRALSEQELLTGSKGIYNTILNPATVTDVTSDELLTTVNQQNTQTFKKGLISAYADLIALLKHDVTEEFLRRFKKLFINVLQPDYPLLYEENEGVEQ
jgi:hypothetical protein